MLIVISSLSQFHFVNFHFCTIYSYIIILFILPLWRVKSLIYIIKENLNKIIQANIYLLKKNNFNPDAHLPNNEDEKEELKIIIITKKRKKKTKVKLG